MLPSAGLTQLAERIRSHSAAISQSQLDRTAIPSQVQATELPFVGRAAEYQRLVSLYHLNQRQPQIAVITGEAGMGKTRLSHAFLDWVAVTDTAADILHGRAYEMGGRLPYQPIVEALRFRMEQINAPEDLLADSWLAELSQLLPELRDRYPDLPPAYQGETPDFVRARLFEAVARCTEALAQKRPFLLFIDDLLLGRRRHA